MKGWLAVTIPLLAWLPATWASGQADCSTPLSNLVRLQQPLRDIEWYDGEEVVLEGFVRSIAGPHGQRTFFVQVSIFAHSCC